MKADLKIDIIDVTDNQELERFLYRCIFHSKLDTATSTPYRKHEDRSAYLEFAIPKGFRKKVLFLEGDYVGTIEYAPVEVSGLPIVCENVIVMNCIWVHRKAQGNNLGQVLINEMVENENQANGFATLALEDYWMIWMRRKDMERLGFTSIESTELRHKLYHNQRCFKMHLMWLPTTESVRIPTWEDSKLLEGVRFCPHHPIYREKYGVRKLGIKNIYTKC